MKSGGVETTTVEPAAAMVGGRSVFSRRLDHTKSDQDCRDQKAAENYDVNDPTGYGHLLICGFLGSVQHDLFQSKVSMAVP